MFNLTLVVLLLSLAMSSYSNTDVNIPWGGIDDDDEDNWDGQSGSGNGNHLDQTTQALRTTTRRAILPDDSNDSNFPIIAVCASIGAVVIILLLIMVIIFCVRRKNKRKLRQLPCQSGSQVSYSTTNNTCEVRVPGMGRVGSKPSTQRTAGSRSTEQTAFIPNPRANVTNDQKLNSSTSAADHQYETPRERPPAYHELGLADQAVPFLRTGATEVTYEEIPATQRV